MARMIEMVIDSVRVSLTNPQRIVILHEINSDHYLPIWIGPYEAESITIALQEVEVARPQTHDLLKNLLQALDAHLIRVEIVALRDDVFYGNLIVEMDNQTYEIDSRPSDALALAVRMHIPILVSQDVLDSAGIVPEQEGQNVNPETTPQDAQQENSGSELNEERLSVFEDFLDNLDLDENDIPSEGDPDEDNDEEDKPKPL